MELVNVDTMDDVVNDICFDYHGKRFAACSMDKRISVFDGLEVQGERRWSRTGDIPRAHNDCVWRLSWAHPEFGQLLASCSEDGTVHVWEEADRVSSQGKGERWQRKAQSTRSLSICRLTSEG